ncbi:enoyl-CoA hydratase [Faunimonas sp. B44]|uniref:enoyl-CoA hydratase n=1 Tax=Faunimonas sp. B44 TaxID=3461493 RepID=UPI004044E427
MPGEIARPLAAAGPLRSEAPQPGVMRLVLAAPPANTLSETMIGALQDALDRAATEEAIRVVVIASEGAIFSGGHDLKELTARRSDPDGGRGYFEAVFGSCSRMMQSIQSLPKPVVAEVGGLATAAGCQLVASCDIAIASTAARFGVNGVDFGLFCSTPMVALSRNVAPKTALDMLMTGTMIGAEQAREAGLVSRVAAPERLRAATDEVVARLLARPAAVLALGKRAFQEQLRMPVADAYRFATATIVDNMLMEEAREGIGAFIEKRHPDWSAR